MTEPRPGKLKARLAIAAAVVGAGAIAATIYFTGALIRWDGNYKGSVSIADEEGYGGAKTARAAGASAGVALTGDGKGGVTVVLTAPDLKNGSCSIPFVVKRRRMEVVGAHQCSALRRDYSVEWGEARTSSDGLFVEVSFAEMPVPETNPSRVVVTFVGAPTSETSPLPSIFPSETKEEAARARWEAEKAKEEAAKTARAEKTKPCWDRWAQTDCGTAPLPDVLRGERSAAYDKVQECKRRKNQILDDCLAAAGDPRDAGAPDDQR